MAGHHNCERDCGLVMSPNCGGVFGASVCQRLQTGASMHELNQSTQSNSHIDAVSRRPTVAMRSSNLRNASGQ